MAEDSDILKGDSNIQDACENLRQHGDNLAHGRTCTEEDKKRVWSVKVDGVEIGYRLQVFQTYLNRQVFIKVPGYRITDLSDGERERIMAAVFNVFVHQGSNLPSVDGIAPDTILMQQQIIPEILIERKPGLVSIAGGWGGG